MKQFTSSQKLLLIALISTTFTARAMQALMITGAGVAGSYGLVDLGHIWTNKTHNMPLPYFSYESRHSVSSNAESYEWKAVVGAQSSTEPADPAETTIVRKLERSVVPTALVVGSAVLLYRALVRD